MSLVQAELLSVSGAFLLKEALFQDNRGAFEVFWEEPHLAAHGIRFRPTNAHHSYNRQAGTLRGMHYQKPPYGQAKLVSCVRGSLWDVMVDLRQDSPTYLRWSAVELKEASGQAVYIPAGCAHGFVTLQDQTTIAYLIEGDYRPEAAAVLRWNDPAAGIQWPVATPILSKGDQEAPDYIL